MGTLPRLEILIKETATQPDILYIAIIDSQGEILAHSSPEKVGEVFLDQSGIAALDPDREVKWRTTPNPISAFEVYKLFLPVIAERHESHMMKHRRRATPGGMRGRHETGWAKGLLGEKLLSLDKRPIIVVGLDPTSFERAMTEDIKLMALISGILLLLGIAGIVSLFWAQSYSRSKKLLSNISAISSEMINNLPEGILLTDSDLNLHYMNDIAADLLAVDIRTAQGKDITEILPRQISSMSISVDQNGKLIESETELEHGNKVVIPVSVIVTEVRTEEGLFVGRMYLIRDLSQIKQLQSEIQRKDKMAAIGDLAAGVAHEVRNPLSSIKGYASYFKTLFEEGTENYSSAQILISETDRLDRAITELLEISRPSDIKLKSIEIKEIFDTTLRLLQPDSVEQNQIKLSLEIENNMRTLYVDPDRFVQVLMNIYLNSIQAMPDGGHLRTVVSSDNKWAKIVITDTGSGMPISTREQMFNPYFTTKKTGTGLGMAIVLKIIEAHNGEVSVFSEEGKGTEITIYLPKVIQ